MVDKIDNRKPVDTEPKPLFLYHGSPDPNIIEFEPRVSRGSGKKDGPNVYATNDERLKFIQSKLQP